ncbi:DNA oxidative demethylase AlkB [Iodobacter sp. CM08]|uniref:DNA oxidative demethylase AlkB n=1 Tax=Iodobacter sp. CM08 TaxID=3085902 RepID=UPI002980C007|nr:DNA oxidative demethylase AlkB [Iodobacter sp. CM08]MDW5418360.1 DNA oxidative demethylase AlkB [Iodobacter sp. CM08]
MDDLFAELDDGAPQELAAGVVLLRGFVREQASLLLAVAQITQAAPFRQMSTPGGYVMSVEMSNCGALGWIADRHGYRYVAHDPLTGEPWPAMPEAFLALARRAGLEAGFADFSPDVCLINRYVPSTKLSMHQDKDEADFSAPIVSVSLGLPAVFVLGGLQRNDPSQRIGLSHGDVLVWGGPARLRYHGVLALKHGNHVELGACRINLTFRQAA